MATMVKYFGTDCYVLDARVSPYGCRVHELCGPEYVDNGMIDVQIAIPVIGPKLEHVPEWAALMSEQWVSLDDVAGKVEYNFSRKTFGGTEHGTCVVRR